MKKMYNRFPEIRRPDFDCESLVRLYESELNKMPCNSQKMRIILSKKLPQMKTCNEQQEKLPQIIRLKMPLSYRSVIILDKTAKVLKKGKTEISKAWKSCKIFDYRKISGLCKFHVPEKMRW